MDGCLPPSKGNLTDEVQPVQLMYGLHLMEYKYYMQGQALLAEKAEYNIIENRE